jgi:hypothetical protein
MTEFVSDPIARIARQASVSERKTAAVAYVTKDHAQMKDGDLLVCDASDRMIESRATCRNLLKRLVDSGVRVFSNDLLHSKMIVFDHCTAFVGSANLSQFAEQRIESGVFTDDKQAVAASEKFINALASISEQVDDEFLRRIFQLKLKQRKLPPRTKKLRGLEKDSKAGLLKVSYWFFKGTRNLSGKSQAVAEKLRSSWAVNSPESTTEDYDEILEDEDPLELAPLEHSDSRWMSNLAIGDRVFWCYFDEDWGWIVLPPRTVVKKARAGRSLIAGAEGRYWDDWSSIRLELFIEKTQIRKNASLHRFNSDDHRIDEILSEWNELVD